MYLDFRIDWGYQYLYSRRHYHPVFRWDGDLSCDKGKILETRLLDYPVIWYGPGHCARETLLDAPRWESTTRRGISGVRVTAEAEPDALFFLHTLSGDFTFSAADIAGKGRIVFPVGPKYLGCHVIVTRTGYFWFQEPAKPGQTIWEADDFASQLPVRDWARMRTAWLAPGESLSFKADIADSGADLTEQILHIVAMIAPGYTPGDEKQAADFIPLKLCCDGKTVAENTRYFRCHDNFMQMLEDEWLRFQVSPGEHTFRLENGHKSLCFLINRLILQNAVRQHGELSFVPWALIGEKIRGRVFAAHSDFIQIHTPEKVCELPLSPGWNDFFFSLHSPFLQGNVTTSLGTTHPLPVIYDLKDETPEVKVGYDMTTIPHENSGFMDWILDYTARTKLGNLVVFRSFLPNRDEIKKAIDEDELLFRWADFCRTHNIYVEAANRYESGALIRGAGAMLHSVGRHEYSGAVYAFDPTVETESPDMKTAMEKFIARLKTDVDNSRKRSPRSAFGDASGGQRYAYMAGVDFIRSETMVPHTQHLCSQARPAAEFFRNGEWGVHIAIQHAVQPYFETHLGQYFLSLYQPWMMGASMIYEEDCLFNLFKEERQAWDDKLTKGKRDMTREFFRFVKTHPRTGKTVRKIAFIEGRYAAPFNGFICDSEQTPDYSVWGLFGNRDETWGHRQPEKCRQLLDVLMPGASTHPLRQDFNKRRFFFSGTPYGDFDEVPVEVSADYLKQYSLLLHLGWNTMISEDYQKLLTFVREGGTLLTGLPQFSTHVKRDFLREMKDLSLWNNGDLSELCGVKIQGYGSRFSGSWNCADREKFPAVSLSAIPSHSPDEDGPCHLADVELAGAEPVIWDAVTGKPVVLKHRCGKGTVYLITAFAYPGHEELQKLSAPMIARLAGEHLPECHVKDPSGEVFWNMHIQPDGVRRLMLLNTDWSTAGNCKKVKIVTPQLSFETMVREREPKIITILPRAVLEQSPELHIEYQKDDTLKLHGTGTQSLLIHTPEGNCIRQEIRFTDTTTMEIKL